MADTSYKFDKDLIVYNVEEIYEEIKSLPPEAEVMLDLSMVNEIDYAGLQLLISVNKNISSGNGKLILNGLKDEIKDRIVFSGADKYLLFD